MKTQEYKIKLEEEKKELESQLADIGIYSEETGKWDAIPEKQEFGPEADENDLADRAEDYEERTSLLTTLATRLDEIKGSLKEIEEGNYGKCHTCGNQIEEDRLEANPAAHTCKNCM